MNAVGQTKTKNTAAKEECSDLSYLFRWWIFWLWTVQTMDTHTHFNRPTAVLSPLSFHCRPLTSNLCALHCKVEKEQRALQCGRSMPIAVLSLQCDRYRMAGGHDYSTTLSIGQWNWAKSRFNIFSVSIEALKHGHESYANFVANVYTLLCRCN